MGKLNFMKRKFFAAAILLLLTFAVVLPSCQAREAGSVKALTKPYIAQYECTDCYLGSENLLEKYDYIRIVLGEKNSLQILVKPKNEEKQIYKGKYEFDFDTRVLSADIAVFGFAFKPKTTVENGKFTVTKQIGKKQLIIKFKAQ